MNEVKLKGMLGLALRARKLVTGSLPVEKALASGKALLVLADEGMSADSMKKLESACLKKNVPLRKLPAAYLEQAVSNPGRMCACVTDKNFSDRINELMD